jgi:hypothetical protein
MYGSRRLPKEEEGEEAAGGGGRGHIRVQEEAARGKRE